MTTNLTFYMLDQEKYSALIIPGGAKGAAIISKSPEIQSLVREYIQDNKVVGMICAGVSDVSACFPLPVLFLDAIYCLRCLSRYFSYAVLRSLNTRYHHVGSLTALTAGLPHQPLTSHPSVKGELENRMYFFFQPLYPHTINEN